MRYLIPILLAPAAAFAHPGDHGGESAAHFLTQGDHLALIVAALSAGAVIVALRRRAMTGKVRARVSRKTRR